MAWTPGRWPIPGGVDCPSNLKSCFNELRTELNLRGGRAVIDWEDIDEFAVGKSVFDVIVELRAGTNALISSCVDPVTAKRFIGPWTEPDPLETGFAVENNIFMAVFGAPRLAWLNEPTGAESGLNPTDKGLPYAHYFNELHDVIEALSWTAIDPLDPKWGIIGGLVKNGGSALLLTKQLALDAAWLAAFGDTPSQYYAFSVAEVRCVYRNEGSFPDQYVANFEALARYFISLDLPSYTHGLKVARLLPAANYYQADPDGDIAAGDAFLADLYIDTVDPSDFDPEYWDYGTLGTFLQIAAEITPPGAFVTSDMVDFTPAMVNYVQLRCGDVAYFPQYIVDHGHWHGGELSDGRRFLDPYSLRFLYRFVE